MKVATKYVYQNAYRGLLAFTTLKLEEGMQVIQNLKKP